jgi:hypothetical protein
MHSENFLQPKSGCKIIILFILIKMKVKTRLKFENKTITFKLKSIQFLHGFANLRKATIKFMSACPSVCMEQLGSYWTDFHEIWHKRIKKKNSTNFKICYNLTRITSTSHGEQYTFLIIFRSIILKMRNVSYKFYRENQNTHFIYSNLFSKFAPFMR